MKICKVNRPFWLDTLYLKAFFGPPAVLTAVATALLAGYFEKSGQARLCVYVGSVALAELLWLCGLITWLHCLEVRSDSL